MPRKPKKTHFFFSNCVCSPIKTPKSIAFCWATWWETAYAFPVLWKELGERKNHPLRETFQAKTAVQSAFLHHATRASNCSAGIVKEDESHALHSKPSFLDLEKAKRSGGLKEETPLPATRATEKPASKSICNNSRSAFAPFAYLVKKSLRRNGHWNNL